MAYAAPAGKPVVLRVATLQPRHVNKYCAVDRNLQSGIERRRPQCPCVSNQANPWPVRRPLKSPRPCTLPPPWTPSVIGTHNTTPAVYFATLLCTNPCKPPRPPAAPPPHLRTMTLNWRPCISTYASTMALEAADRRRATWREDEGVGDMGATWGDMGETWRRQGARGMVREEWLQAAALHAARAPT